MPHLRRLKCSIDGYEPSPEETICPIHGGTDDWIWYCDRHNLTTTNKAGCERCGYSFAGKVFFNPVLLAAELAVKWDKALDVMQCRPLINWIADDLGDSFLANRLGVFNSTKPIDPEIVLAASIATLNPSAPLFWRGLATSRTDFITSGIPKEFEKSEVATKIIASTLPQWTSDIHGCRWLAELQTHCTTRAKVIGLSDLRSATPWQWWFLLAMPDTLQACAVKIRNEFGTSTDSRLSPLFEKNVLTEFEALELATATKSTLLTIATAWEDLIANILPKLSSFIARSQERPITQKILKEIEREFDECVRQLRKKREHLRVRQPNLVETPSLLIAIDATRVALRHAFKAHGDAGALVEGLRQLINQGHIRHAIMESITVRLEIAAFSDLDLGFVIEGERRLKRIYRRVFFIGVVVVTSAILTIVIIKISAH